MASNNNKTKGKDRRRRSLLQASGRSRSVPSELLSSSSSSSLRLGNDDIDDIDDDIDNDSLLLNLPPVLVQINDNNNNNRTTTTSSQRSLLHSIPEEHHNHSNHNHNNRNNNNAFINDAFIDDDGNHNDANDNNNDSSSSSNSSSSSSSSEEEMEILFVEEEQQPSSSSDTSFTITAATDDDDDDEVEEGNNINVAVERRQIQLSPPPPPPPATTTTTTLSPLSLQSTTTTSRPPSRGRGRSSLFSLFRHRNNNSSRTRSKLQQQRSSSSSSSFVSAATQQRRPPSTITGHQTLRMSNNAVGGRRQQEPSSSSFSDNSAGSGSSSVNTTISSLLRQSSLGGPRHITEEEDDVEQGQGRSTTTDNGNTNNQMVVMAASIPTRSQLRRNKRRHPTNINNYDTTSMSSSSSSSLAAAKAAAAAVQDDASFFEQQQDALRDTCLLLNCSASSSSNNNNNIHVEVTGCIGKAWRAILRHAICFTTDAVNAKRLGRTLQQQVPFLTGYESCLLWQVIQSLDTIVDNNNDGMAAVMNRGRGRGRRGYRQQQQPPRQQLSAVLATAFQNRNVSRVIVQNVLGGGGTGGSISRRYDWLWHWDFALRWNRVLDAIGLLPLVGSITNFPATENFPTTTTHALQSILRVVLGQGHWITRVVTGGREGLITDSTSKTIAQNLAAESNNFELANRNQYGTYFGRIRTNQFRLAHRLPTDESLVRTFISQPIPSTTNNGVVHTLLCLANHWESMLLGSGSSSQEDTINYGNFAHQRMELLDPIDILRFHMPQLLITISSLRGRNVWDQSVLSAIVKKLQNLRPLSNLNDIKVLVNEIKDTIVVPVCGGIGCIVDPFQKWLGYVQNSLSLLEKEAQAVYELVSSVELGIRLGYDIMMTFAQNSKVPSDKVLKRAILQHIRGGEYASDDEVVVKEQRIQQALQLTTPRDKRTLIELVENDLVHTQPAQLLLNRVKTILQREIRRHQLNETIRQLSKGDSIIGSNELVEHELYWLEGDEYIQQLRNRRRKKRHKSSNKASVHIYLGKVDDGTSSNSATSSNGGGHRHYSNSSNNKQGLLRFLHADSGVERIVSLDTGVKFRTFVPVAEAISRAQKASMTIELDHLRVFTYEAFMEFTFLRIALGRLAVVSQMACEEIDTARINVLSEIQRSVANHGGGVVVAKPEDLEPGTTYYMLDSSSNATNTKQSYRPFICHKKFKSPHDLGYSTLAANKIVKVLPQNVLVVGGGPTGLMTAIHCTENVLSSGGCLKLYEARDAFEQGGSTFERAQIVRLDARWIAMLRYHLGTAFEDYYISLSGETDSQLGNTLPTQGFIEITIKDLENMLHVEVSKLWSRNVLTVYSDSKAQYDAETNSLTKYGINLKIDDIILRRVDEEGRPCKKCQQYYSWKVVELTYTKPLHIDDLRVGRQYGVFIRAKQRILPYRLVAIDLESKIYTFKSLSDDNVVVSNDTTATSNHQPLNIIKFHARSLPSIYPKGTDAKVHGKVHSVVLESMIKGSHGGYVRDELSMDVVSHQKFTLDIQSTHVVEAIGKPHDSKEYFLTTPPEPYGTVCLQGLKVSMGMHNFGEKRWGSGLMDDVRSINDTNTRIVGDFTKMVRASKIYDRMYELITTDPDWQCHFENLIESESHFPELNEFDPVIIKIVRSCQWLAENSTTFRRQTLQTRFFETGDIFYLGMEFNREFDQWKKDLTSFIVGPQLQMMNNKQQSNNKKRLSKKKEQLESLCLTLNHHFDRLFFTACLSTLKLGDVYNPGAWNRVPDLCLINSHNDVALRSLPAGESFRVTDDPEDELYEVLVKPKPAFLSHCQKIVVRNVDGCVSRMTPSVRVKRQSNLTRAPDGNAESKVALASFPLGHYVNYRSMRHAGIVDTTNSMDKGVKEENGYVFIFAGDGQATPHFMRYSGLTGAAINVMSFNNFIKQATDGAPYLERFQQYSNQTNWSNEQVVKRGTHSGPGPYGEDGFLRPGFSYKEAVDFLHSKVVEFRDSANRGLKDNDDSTLLSPGWKVKFIASLIPKGMELNGDFLSSLRLKIMRVILDKFLQDLRESNDEQVSQLAKDFADNVLESADDAIIRKLCNINNSNNNSIYRSSFNSSSSSTTEVNLQSFCWNTLLSSLFVGNAADNSTIAGASNSTDDNNSHASKTFTMLSLLCKPYVTTAKHLTRTFEQIIEYSKKQHLYGKRISSELQNQPKPVDSIIDDFAVEAQNFANSLALASAFAAGALAFRLVHTSSADIVSAVLGVLNIIISFATMTNVGRYKIRNEESRIEFMDGGKSDRIKRTLFRCMMMTPFGNTTGVSQYNNPFLLDLKKKVEKFRADSKYYGHNDDEQVMEEFNHAYSAVVSNGAIGSRNSKNNNSSSDRNNQLQVLQCFQKKIITQFIHDYDNSYVKESLVDVYSSVGELIQVVAAAAATTNNHNGGYNAADDNVDSSALIDSTSTLSTTVADAADTATIAALSAALFDSLLNQFEPKLEASMQRGDVRWGFIKRRKFCHWDIVVAVRYFISLFIHYCCQFQCRRKSSSQCTPTIETETFGVLEQIWELSATIENQHRDKNNKQQQKQQNILRREIRDIETLYWATRESDIASLIFLSALLVFISSIVFTIARIFSIEILEMVAFWAVAASAFGSILAMTHFYRKLIILVRLWFILGSKLKLRRCRHNNIGSSNIGYTNDSSTTTATAAAVDNMYKNHLSKIRSVAGTQVWLTVLRFVAALTASIALPYSVAIEQQAYYANQNNSDTSDFNTSSSIESQLPVYIALVSVGTAIASTFFFFVVEYYIRYKLTPTLGPFVCECFRDEIQTIYDAMVLSDGHKNAATTTNNKDVSKENETWEYVAREFLHEYRFDTVFAADRFGMILQYIQGGMDARTDYV